MSELAQTAALIVIAACALVAATALAYVALVAHKVVSAVLSVIESVRVAAGGDDRIVIAGPRGGDKPPRT